MRNFLERLDGAERVVSGMRDDGDGAGRRDVRDHLLRIGGSAEFRGTVSQDVHAIDAAVFQTGNELEVSV